MKKLYIARMISYKYYIILFLFLTTNSLQAEQLAFPGAQGWGRFAKGGRTGEVYHVTNLNDSGTGSLRDAVSSSNRIVVFDVSGVINISSRIVFSSNIYVAGQTAPGEGITVYGDGVSFSGASNIIVRYIRFRMGKNGTSGKDAAGIANGTNMIFDHCSFSWGLDETFSINPDGKGDLHSITISNCIISQGLLTHSAGGLMQADSITLYRNLYCDNSTRNNKVKGTCQYVNNLVYNWKNGCFLMGGDSEGNSYVNATNNLFINGPMTSTSANAFTSGNENFHIYAFDNWQDKNENGIYDPTEIPQSDYSGPPTFVDAPYNYPTLEAWNATDLIDSLLPNVGATLPYRDLVDFYVVSEVNSFGTEGTLISSESQLPVGIPSSWDTWSYTKPTDSDSDGMPDAWEEANGCDSSKDDAMTIASNGYANIENYINSLSKDNRQLYLRAPVLLTSQNSTDTTITLKWYDFTEEEEGFIVESLIDETYKQIAQLEANISSYTVSSLTPGTAYSFRICAFKGEEKSDYTSLSTKTQPEYVEMIDCETFEGDGDKLWLIANTQDTIITLNADAEKDAVVVRSDYDVTINGNGAISGTASLNKTGKGVLTLSNTNSYTGATVLHNGTISFSSLKNGGENSSLGASQDYAQNWIWDGGTWDYTGSSTSTDRNVQMYSSSEFNIKDANTTVTFNGSISGSGDFILNGEGVLKPSDASFFNYDGATELKGGTLQLEYIDSDQDKVITLGAEENVSSKLILSGGNLITKGSNDLYASYDFPIEVQQGTYSTMTFQRNCSILCKVSGAGTLEYKVPYVREYIKGDWTEFYGTLIANGIGTSTDGSQLMFLNSSYQGMPNTMLYLMGNTRVLSWNTNDELYLGGLSGDAGTYLSASSKNTSNANMIWHIGGANSDEEFNGIIDNRCSANKYNGTTSIIKEGSGDWRLNGNNIYSGTTVVSGGRLIVNGENSGTGAYTVNANSTLAGKGTIGGKITIDDEGILFAGDTLIDKSSLTLLSTLTLKDGATLNIPADNSKCNSITLGGTLTIKGSVPLVLAENGFSSAPYDATTYHLINLNGNTISGTFSEIIPNSPGEGQQWDTSKLYSDGILTVIGGEENPNPDEDDGEEDEESSIKTALITWGNCTAGSYDNSSYNNMLTGNIGDLAEGLTMVLTGNLQKTYSGAEKIDVIYNGETLNRTSIKTSNGAENTIFLPENARATKLTLWSYCNTASGTRTSYWQTVCGKDYEESESVIIQSSKDVSNPIKVSFDLDSVEVVSFKNTGEQQCIIAYVEYFISNATTSIDGSFQSISQPISMEFYTISGERVAIPNKGLYIVKITDAKGNVISKKVVY